MFIKRTTLIILSFFLFKSCLFAQITPNNFNSTFEDKLLYEVKQLDQFIGRFNLSENIYGNKYPKDMADSIKKNDLTYISVRRKILLSLFDFENSNNDTSLIKRFVNEMINNSHGIYFNDKNWYAEVKTTVLFDGKEKNAQIILQIEKNSEEELKWVIRGVKANFLDFSPEVTKDFINPMSHETYFIVLKKVFEDKNHIKQYAYKNYRTDNLSIFLYLISQNKIQFKNTITISYHFLQIDNFIFTIDFFNRSTYNSGWLISHLIEANDKMKKQYLEKTLKIYD